MSRKTKSYLYSDQIAEPQKKHRNSFPITKFPTKISPTKLFLKLDPVLSARMVGYIGRDGNL